MYAQEVSPRNQANECTRNHAKVCLKSTQSTYGQEIQPMYPKEISLSLRSLELRLSQLKRRRQSDTNTGYIYEEVSDDYHEAPSGEFKNQKSGMQTVPVLNILTHVCIVVWICLSFH